MEMVFIQQGLQFQMNKELNKIHNVFSTSKREEIKWATGST